jgi:uncharacterized protein YndB with AHSA1/START domain
MNIDERASVTLPSEREILIERRFAAPRHLVYRAWTTPELVRRWWCGLRGTMTQIEIDLRVGGQWRYVMRASECFEIAFHGEYKELVADERIVTTEVFEMPGSEEPGEGEAPLNVVSFSEAGGQTTIELRVICPTRELRDQILSSGMETGMQEQMVLLDELARSLR